MSEVHVHLFRTFQISPFRGNLGARWGGITARRLLRVTPGRRILLYHGALVFQIWNRHIAFSYYLNKSARSKGASDHCEQVEHISNGNLIAAQHYKKPQPGGIAINHYWSTYHICFWLDPTCFLSSEREGRREVPVRILSTSSVRTAP